ncbi:MAG TPA: DNA double-strand break repair nuclease NurA [Actinomycetota bacterium]|nr:DNA double-strand break repair nuclease NurA [Actinomycetota bacterium]
MKFAVESWAPEYGAPIEAAEGLDPTSVQVDASIEMPVTVWRPVEPPATTTVPDRTLFTDGIRRVDARVWVDGDSGSHAGLCASYAAGAVMCDGRARIVAAEVERGLFTLARDAQAITCRHAIYPVRRPETEATQDLVLSVHYRMGELEMALAQAQPADLVIVDGPLKGRHGMANVVGYVKTHHVSYLPPELDEVVARLECGERTPVFLIGGKWSKHSWYMRLPCDKGHTWTGVVRCEVTGDVEVADVVTTADRVTGMLPRYSSQSHKDARAPQNLHPIAGLERELRRRLGDVNLLYRGLRIASMNGDRPAA